MLRLEILDQLRFLGKILALSLLLFSKACETVQDESVSKENTPIVLLISLDGFAQQYRSWIETATLDSLANSGVQAQVLLPVFPTKTFPNHYTQVTGLYPAHHGIISNRMFDGEFKQYFSLDKESPSTRDGKWYGGEPIWVTAKNHGIITATMFWPGSEAEIGGSRPDYFIPFNGAIGVEARIDQILDWIRMTDSPQFLSLYFEQVDQAGHLHGPYSAAVEKMVKSIDQAIGNLMHSIKQMGMQNLINIIIVSDHGMAALSREKVIFLEEYVDLKTVEVINWSPVLELIPNPGMGELIFNRLSQAHEHLKVYYKGSMPDAWNYQGHRRITPILAIADEGWSITTREYFDNHWQAFRGGTHGYDPRLGTMGGIFIATGPFFMPGVTLGPTESVHLYSLMCHILGIDPADNDGNLEVWEKALIPGQ